MKQYSLWQNICYVYQIAFREQKKLRFTVPAEVLLAILIPLLGSLVPTCAVSLLERGTSMGAFFLVMGMIALVCAAVYYLNTYLSFFNDYRYISVRAQAFRAKIYEKCFITAYSNVEPHQKQLELEKALMATNNNRDGCEGVMHHFPKLVISVSGLSIYAAFLGNINLLILVILVVMTVSNLMLSLYAQKKYEKGLDEYAQIYKKQRYLYDNSLSPVNGKDMRLYRIEKWFSQLFLKLISEKRQWNWKIRGPFVFPELSNSVFLLIRDLLAYTILIRMVTAGNLSIAGFTFYVNIIGGFTIWLNQAVEEYEDLRECKVSISHHRHYLDYPERIPNQQLRTGTDIEKLKGTMSVEFQNVSFTYPGAQSPTIPNINLYIKPGEKIALVGVNGAGKTSIVKLLAGFYRPDSGSILVNGQNIEAFPDTDYLQKVGVVFQETFVLAFTIAQNVACCPENEIDYSRVRKCLELAGLWEKVDSLEHKEYTVLTKKLQLDGILLSGGETQKLMLARALYKDAPFMILDEPTAALDPIAEAELYEKYRQLTEGKTSIFISHRLASTQFCDRILFLENGQVIEQGTHRELMAAGGKYAKMFEVQSSYYKKKMEVVCNEM